MLLSKEGIVGHAFYVDGRVVVVPGNGVANYTGDLIGPVFIVYGQLVVAYMRPKCPLSMEQYQFALATVPKTEPREFGRAIWLNGCIEVLFGPAGARPAPGYVGRAVLIDNEMAIILDGGDAPRARVDVPSDSSDSESDEDLLTAAPHSPSPSRVAVPSAPARPPKRSRLLDMDEATLPFTARPLARTIVTRLREVYSSTALHAAVYAAAVAVDAIVMDESSVHMKIPEKSVPDILADCLDLLIQNSRGNDWFRRSEDGYSVHRDFYRNCATIGIAFRPDAMSLH
jgi:hypothetical protein